MFIIPTLIELNQKLWDFHILNNHASYNFLKENIDEIGYLWNDYTNDIKDYCNKCPICIQKSKYKKIDKKVTPIIVNGPNFRYQMDLTELDQKIQNELDTNILLSIIDQFSRLAYVYPLKTKNVDQILIYIKDFIAHHGKPKEFLSDNGR